MKYRLTETEKNDSNYKYQEEYDTLEEAQKRMKTLYGNYYENPAVEKSEINENSAIVCINDGNEIEWDIESTDDIIENAFEDDEALSEYEMQERLEKVMGEDYIVRQNDSWIDDGCDEDEEDEYVMGVSFTIKSKKDGDITDVNIYYGDVTGKIGWVRII